MPNPSELTRQEYDRAAPSANGEIGPQIAMPSREEQEHKLEQEMNEFDEGLARPPGTGSFEKELEQLINKHSMEAAGGDTPDFILARYLRLQLDIFHATVRRRAYWYGARDELIRG